MNTVHLLGRLTATPEFRTISETQQVCKFRIAVQRNKDKSDFFNVSAWDKTAEIVNKNFVKGDRILLTGSIRNADYEDKSGVKHYAVEIIANSVNFIELKNKNNEETNNEK